MNEDQVCFSKKVYVHIGVKYFDHKFGLPTSVEFSCVLQLLVENTIDLENY